jgi:hypothetical protein
MGWDSLQADDASDSVALGCGPNLMANDKCCAPIATPLPCLACAITEHIVLPEAHRYRKPALPPSRRLWVVTTTIANDSFRDMMATAVVAATSSLTLRPAGGRYGSTTSRAPWSLLHSGESATL